MSSVYAAQFGAVRSLQSTTQGRRKDDQIKRAWLNLVSQMAGGNELGVPMYKLVCFREVSEVYIVALDGNEATVFYVDPTMIQQLGWQEHSSNPWDYVTQILTPSDHGCKRRLFSFTLARRLHSQALKFMNQTLTVGDFGRSHELHLQWTAKK